MIPPGATATRKQNAAHRGEARWDDHQRKITVYRFDAGDGAGTYREALEYTTAQKYDAEDTNTINSEMNVILTRVGLSGESRE